MRPRSPLRPALLPAAFMLAAGCGGDGSDCGPSRAEVERVIDGDTVDLAGGQRLRYLMIDTPESTGGNSECYGRQAADYNAMLVAERRVRLRYDSECRDQYDRLLAYVEVDGVEVNLRLVEEGYACVLIIPPNGEQRRQEYEAAEFEARQLARGMWGACEEVGCE